MNELYYSGRLKRKKAFFKGAIVKLSIGKLNRSPASVA
jgi:hypothetical protein